MQKNRKTPIQWFKNLYSKFKFWCASNNVPMIIFPILAILIAAGSVLIIGATVLGWDIAGFVTSPTGILLGTLVILALLLTAGYVVHRR